MVHTPSVGARSWLATTATRMRTPGPGGPAAAASRGHGLPSQAPHWHRYRRRRAHIPPPAVAGGGRSRRASGTGTCLARGDRDAPDVVHACAAGHTSRRMIPPPAVAGGARSRERHGDVLGSQRSRSAGCGTRLCQCRLEHIPPPGLFAAIRYKDCGRRCGQGAGGAGGL